MREQIRREGDAGYLWRSPSFSESLQVHLSAGRYWLLVCIADGLWTATVSSELALELRARARAHRDAAAGLQQLVAGCGLRLRCGSADRGAVQAHHDGWARECAATDACVGERGELAQQCRHDWAVKAACILGSP
eukprot:1424447-Rhodomonas_salina.1